MTSYAYLLECFDHDAASGTLTWRERPRCHFASDGAWKRFNNMFSGKTAGYKIKGGYIKVCLNTKMLFVHRIIWALIKRMDLVDVPLLDHADLDPSNNREANLRPATGAQNQQNIGVKSNNTSGFKGISWQKSSGRWHTYIKVDGKRKHLGLFKDIEDAVAARAAAQHLHGEFARLTANDNKPNQEVAA